MLRGAHTQSAPQMFPSCLCTAATSIIALLDDTAVTPDGMAVYCVAQRVSRSSPEVEHWRVTGFLGRAQEKWQASWTDGFVSCGALLEATSLFSVLWARICSV